MWDVSGVEGAAPLWHDVMERLGDQTPDELLTAVMTAESASHARSLSMEPQAAIVSPVDGSVYARDPGIPPETQRVILEAVAPLGTKTNALPTLRLDGALLPVTFDRKAHRLQTVWKPLQGEHLLALHGARGEKLDEVRFRVK